MFAWIRLLLVALPLWVLAAPALAQDDGAPEELNFAQKVDKFFGDYPNEYLGNRLLYRDVIFWDDNLALGEGVGTEVGEETVVAYRDGEGYVYKKRFVEATPILVLDAPTRRTFDKIEVELRSANRKNADGTDSPIVVGKVLEQPVDLKSVKLEGAVPETPDEEAIVSVVGLAPFAVKVDRRSGKVVPVDLVLKPEMIELAAGDTVFVAGDTRAELVEQGEDGWLALGLEERIDATALPNPDAAAMPAVVLWLVLGSIFFTFRMMFVNLWGFVHAIKVTAGVYDNPEDEGEISHFQALSSALSATVGLGNIAGVAIAITVGGPGAIFWMVTAGFLGMTSKFTECTLGQMYRKVRPDGSVSGGPMHYLRDGLTEIGVGPLGIVLSWMFAIMCVGGSFGGGNMFQANQSFSQVAEASAGMLDPANPFHRLTYGIILAVFVGVVIIGGIKRIGAAASMIVPVMCVIYVAAGMLIIVVNAAAVPAAIGAIVSEAFTPAAGLGGVLGVLAQGFKRASFSSEAGVGSASIAHSAAQTPYPVREGIVALLEPFIDTIVVCSTTGLVVVVTGVYQQDGVGAGVTMTSRASDSVKSCSIQVSSASAVASGWFAVRSPQRPCQPSRSRQRLACPSSTRTGRSSGVWRPSRSARAAGAVQLQPATT